MKWKTSITKIENEKEVVRGKNLEDLVRVNTFTEAIYLILKGELPNKKEAQMLDALLVASLDHGVGAPSATVARTVASTGNSLHTAVSAGVQTLGELHGGAIEGAGKFFQENVKELGIGVGIDCNQSLPAIENMAKSLKEKKVRVAGYGHKVLTHDYRADTLFEVAKETGFYKNHCEFAVAIGENLNKLSSKPLPLNIDGAMAAILSDMGFDYKLMKGFFVIGRVPGLVAHVYEQMMSGEGIKRLDENEIEYIG